MSTKPSDAARLVAIESRMAALEARLAAMEARVSAQDPPAKSPQPARPRRQNLFQRPDTTAIAVVSALESMGGAATIAQLRAHLPERAHSSIRRACQELRDAGRLRQIAIGTYEIAIAE